MRSLDLYYSVKPWIPRGLQLALRRLRVRHQLKRHAKNWPIHPGSGAAPPDWPGWPGGKRFAVVLTHDVESSRGVERCRALADLEQELGFRSVFNFVPERYATPPELRHELQRRGFEVGIHGLKHDGKLFRSRKIFLQRAARINAYLKEWGAAGFRAPSMLRRLDWLHDLQIEYDLSTFDVDPFQPQPDGVETIFPFMVKASQPERSYAELPYTLDQDFTLFVLMQHDDIRCWQRKADWVIERGGMILLNAHPDYMAFAGDAPDPESYPVGFYRGILEYFQERYAGAYWHALPRDVAAFTRARALQRAFPDPAERAVAGERICFLRHGHFPDDPILKREVDAQAEAGREVDVICLRYNGQMRREVCDGVRVARIPIMHYRATIPRYIFEYGVSFVLMSAMLFWRHLRRRYDLVQVNAMPDFLVFCALPVKWLGARVLLHLYEPTPELFVTKFGMRRHVAMRRLQEWFEQRAMAYADWCFAVSGAIRDRYGQRGADTSKITVLRNVSTEAFDRPAASSSATRNHAFRIITHGLVEKRCGQEVVLKAVKELAREIPELHYDICGGGEYESAIREQVRDMGLDGRVHIWGYVESEKLHELLGAADVGVITMYPSPYAELVDNIRMYEFIALKKPAIVSRFPSIEEVFDDRCVTFARPGDHEDLALKIRELYHHPELARARATKAHERYQALKWARTKMVYLAAIAGLPSPRNH